MRQAAQNVGAGDTAKRFLDMHDPGDMLVAAEFGDPVLDTEMVTLTYQTRHAFRTDQRHLGVRDALLGTTGLAQLAARAGCLATGCRWSPSGQF